MAVQEVCPLRFNRRLAALLRTIYTEQLRNRHGHAETGFSVDLLAKIFGGLKNRGHRVSHRVPAARGIIRKALQGLEALGLVARTGAGRRRLSNQGLAEMEALARQLQQ